MLPFELAHLMLHACKKSRWSFQAKFRDKNKCFVHVLFLVNMILCDILTFGILRTRLFIWIQSADACFLIT